MRQIRQEQFRKMYEEKKSQKEAFKVDEKEKTQTVSIKTKSYAEGEAKE